MKVYHGSYMEIDEIDLSKSELYRDFGRGFYVTNLREQVEYWAKRKGRIAKNKACVTEYNFIESALEHWKFRILRFPAYSEEWLDFVVMNRNPNSPIPVHDYDIVEGPVADDKVTLRLDIYLEGNLSREAFLKELKFFKRTHQICFCTQRSLQALERIHKKKFTGVIDDEITQSLVSDYNLSEREAIDAYFESQTYGMLNDESTGLYQKPWTETYQLLLSELKLKK
ncbi:MAG: DUF3990 domain-containing protein [Tannerellaceae bacterium]|jgi:hypothetical protein|nr:DUF3990 domain-containing protein [Tannerellaceae bacterium]